MSDAEKKEQGSDPPETTAENKEKKPDKPSKSVWLMRGERMNALLFGSRKAEFVFPILVILCLAGVIFVDNKVAGAFFNILLGVSCALWLMGVGWRIRHGTESHMEGNIRALAQTMIDERMEKFKKREGDEEFTLKSFTVNKVRMEVNPEPPKDGVIQVMLAARLEAFDQPSRTYEFCLYDEAQTTGIKGLSDLQDVEREKLGTFTQCLLDLGLDATEVMDGIEYRFVKEGQQDGGS